MRAQNGGWRGHTCTALATLKACRKRHHQNNQNNQRCTLHQPVAPCLWCRLALASHGCMQKPAPSNCAIARVPPPEETPNDIAKRSNTAGPCTALTWGCEKAAARIRCRYRGRFAQTRPGWRSRQLGRFEILGLPIKLSIPSCYPQSDYPSRTPAFSNVAPKSSAFLLRIPRRLPACPAE